THPGVRPSPTPGARMSGPRRPIPTPCGQGWGQLWTPRVLVGDGAPGPAPPRTRRPHLAPVWFRIHPQAVPSATLRVTSHDGRCPHDPHQLLLRRISTRMTHGVEVCGRADRWTTPPTRSYGTSRRTLVCRQRMRPRLASTHPMSI